MNVIHINGNQYQVDVSNNLLQTCLSLDIDVPYFCWHPELGSVGVCRLCAVKQYNDRNDKTGKLVMSCMTPVMNNSIISTMDNEVQKFRKGIIELLMTNHPHDCPVCEEAGNCHLQDMTVMTRHNLRRYKFQKRVHHNQYLGNFISHNMNRCIGCYRCIRYYKDYAGGSDFGVYGISNNIYFGRFKDGDLKSEFSGNLIEVCPTGVFVDKLSQNYYNRKWDLQHSPSICQHCSIGCNVIVGEKYGIVGKLENRYHESINRYFLCDLGRFGYHYIHASSRCKIPFFISKGKNIHLGVNDSIQLISKILKKYKNVIGIGSIRSSIENNFALRKLVGVKNFSSGLLEIEQQCLNLIIDILSNSGIYIPTLSEIEDYDVVLILGEDITQTASRMALSIRQLNNKKKIDNNFFNSIPKWHSAALLNVSNKKNFVYTIYTHETKLDDISEIKYHASVKDQEIFASAIENHISNTSNNFKNLDSHVLKDIFNISNHLSSCRKPLIISGSHSCSLNLIKSSVNIARILKKRNQDVGLVLLTPSSNSIGIGIMSDFSIEKIFHKIMSNNVDVLMILENDLYRSFCKEKINNMLKKLKHIVVFDHQNTSTVKNSTCFLPIKNIFESNGTLINYEGRAQRFFSVFDPKVYDKKSCILDGWKWLYKIYYNFYYMIDINVTVDDVIQEYSDSIKVLNKVKYVAPNSKYRIKNQKIARLSHRASSRTAIYSALNIHEPGQKIDHDTIFSFSMEGIQQPDQNSSYIPFSWSPGWNSLQSLNKYLLKSSRFNSGIRIFDQEHSNCKYFLHKIYHSQDSSKEWRIVPYYCLFGSEELSQYSIIIRNKCSVLYALISIKYQKILNLNHDSLIELKLFNQNFQFYVKFSHTLPLQHLGLPLGFPNVPMELIGKTINDIRSII
ncbi:NADH-quinone oxidoreductase subunit NuoG [Buchnera aphidicola]|uniref:NADH-quinone oxidoreductase subunit NuoG n=1 Tax=Buchnera aphidicola TaxID=9 RepID=UPI0034643B75